MSHLGTRKPVHPDILKSWVDHAHKAEARIAELEADNARLLAKCTHCDEMAAGLAPEDRERWIRLTAEGRGVA